jgi:hypothetical protein
MPGKGKGMGKKMGMKKKPAMGMAKKKTAKKMQGRKKY